ncbi:MAG: S8 family serine peptidase [Alphaproteobacteria bacterium]|nr:S8 family serine peptidase [Alphaproteobacteria bacterium]
MKGFKGGCFLVAALLFSKAASAYATETAQLFYENAKRGDTAAVQSLLLEGNRIDAVDKNGDTALCLALKKNDMATYNRLRAFGVNANHACVQRALGASAEKSGFSWKLAYTIATAVVAAGVGVAAAVGGGGGGGGGGSSDTKPDDDPSGGGDDPSGGGDDPSGGGDDPSGGDDTTPLDVSDFETAEYYEGNFLPVIKASTAYARFYTQDKNGNLQSDLQKVNVGFLDSGLDATNADFAQTSIRGLNRDFGPCVAGDTTDCWRYENGELRFLTDANQFYMMSEGQYNAWASAYGGNYDWNAAGKDSFAPLDNSRDHMHGSHISGIVAADKNDSGMHGVAFSNANLIMARWDYMYAPRLVISKLVDEGAQIINMSFAADSNTLPASLMNEEYYQNNKATLDYWFAGGLIKAAQNNVVMVMAAGNKSNEQPGIYSGFVNVDSLKDTIKNMLITVVATDENGQITGYSNRCGVAKNFCIAAPGGTTMSPIISTGTQDVGTFDEHGTSMATAVVSGSLAFLMGAYPYLSAEEVVALMFETADKTGVHADEDTYGNGLLDLGAATNPQGYLATLSGDSVNSAPLNLQSSYVVVPAAIGESMIKNMPQSMTVFDKYKRPFEVKLSKFVQTTHGSRKNFKNDFGHFMRFEEPQKIKAGNLSLRFANMGASKQAFQKGFIDAAYQTGSRTTSFFFSQNTAQSFGAYHEKATFNPYLSFNDAYGVSNAYSFDDFSFKMGFMYGKNGLYDGDRAYHDNEFDAKAYAYYTGVSYQLTNKLDLGVMTGVMHEDEAVLGLNGEGIFGIEKSRTYYTGASLTFRPFEKVVLSGALYQGYTKSASGAGSIVEISPLQSRSFAFDAQYRHNQTDVSGFQISSPLRIERGYADFDIAVGRDDHSDKVYRKNIKASLKPSAREYKLAFYHNRKINDDTFFKTEIATRFNPEHQRDAKNDYRALLGLSFRF